ncbi:SRPBCC family protein [Longispora sp. NPDC051575]|uniref:SRPBCC family protein n=1 Tax=Longispora sp. NPDC051575 TaxID=3154943 RepID=UPI00342F8198
MVHVVRTFLVDRPVDVVVAFLADFSNAPRWDPGTVRCTPTSTGPLRVGSTWRNVSKVLGRETELDYRLHRLDPDRVTLVGTNKTATSTDDITVKPAPGGAEVTYNATIELHGLAKLAAPIMKLEFERLGNLTEKKIRTTIAQL